MSDVGKVQMLSRDCFTEYLHLHSPLPCELLIDMYSLKMAFLTTLKGQKLMISEEVIWPTKVF